ncbi:hypothetical protein DY000_02026467 [Brassica cretica]|uniref:Uncharacterized protein n=1 Tax=Brassica cretica TaxID=69181 RepID=A0ABQ7E7M1_BRACR|nr:hypothetical protein DY000_02026467 [Brassica cretica]
MHSGQSSSLHPLEKQLWRDLWKTKTSPKLRNFFMAQGPETICHMLFQCPVAKEVKKMAIYKVSEAIKEIRELTSADSTAASRI